MDKIEWPLETNSDQKINIVANKANELVEARKDDLAQREIFANLIHGLEDRILELEKKSARKNKA